MFLSKMWKWNTQLSPYFFKDGHYKIGIFKFYLKIFRQFILITFFQPPQTLPYLPHLATHLTWWFFPLFDFSFTKYTQLSPMFHVFPVYLCTLVILSLWSVLICYWSLALVIYSPNNFTYYHYQLLIVIIVIFYEILNYSGNFKKAGWIVIIIN